jgi:hypothetical protein
MSEIRPANGVGLFAESDRSQAENLLQAVDAGERFAVRGAVQVEVVHPDSGWCNVLSVLSMFDPAACRSVSLRAERQAAGSAAA